MVLRNVDELEAKRAFTADAQVWLQAVRSNYLDVNHTAGLYDRWFQVNCPLLTYVQSCARKFEPGASKPFFDDPEALRAFQGLQAADLKRIAALTLPGSASQVRERCAATMRGMLAAVDACVQIVEKRWLPGGRLDLPGEIGEALRKAVGYYAFAWGLKRDDSSVAAPDDHRGDLHESSAHGATNPPRGMKALGLSVRRDLEIAPAWLAVQTLIEFILDEQPSGQATKPLPGDPRTPVQSRMLLWDETQDEGYVQEVLATRHEHVPLVSWTLDAASLGFTVLEDNLIESLQLAWCASKSALIGKGSSVRLILGSAEEGTTPFVSIGGPSAGALLACAMLAAARGEELNTDSTASVELVPPKDGWSPHADLEIAAIKLEGVGGLCAKLRKARSQGILTVALTEDDCRNARTRCRHSLGTEPTLKLVPCDDLAGVLKALTGNERIERVLADHAKQCIRDWDPGLLGEKPSPDAHRRPQKPVPYVEPHLAALTPPSLDDERDDRNTVDRPQLKLQELLDETTRYAITAQNERDTAEREFGLFLKLGKRICVVEDANGGKTVFTKRLQAFLGSEAGQRLFGNRPARPLLVARFENADDHFSRCWPTDKPELLAALEDLVRPYCTTHQVAPAEVVEYALQRKRVVLILDALDQAGDPGRLLESINIDRHFLDCHVVVTGRTYKFGIGQPGTKFPLGPYQFATLLGFNVIQQSRGLAPFLAGRPIEALFDDYNQAEEQLRVPGMLRLAYDIAKEEYPLADGHLLLRGLRQRADFYWRYYEKLLIADAATKRVGGGSLLVRSDEAKWQMMMAVTAFRMILERVTDFHLPCDRADRVRTDVGRYCALWGKTIDDNDWRNLEAFSVLTDHGVMEGRDDAALSWRHKGWMEFFAGVFLAKYVKADAMRGFDWREIRPEADDENAPGFHCIHPDDFPASVPGSNERFCRAILTQLTNDPDWQWSWRYVAQIPAMPKNHRPDFSQASLEASLDALFQQPARGLRPTELMHYTWPLLEDMNRQPHLMALPHGTEPITCGARILAAFRRQFAEMVDRASDADAPACQLVPLEELLRRGKLSQAEADTRVGRWRYFARCPADPANDCKPFVQGTPDKDGTKEHPHHVHLTPFLMQTTTVTCEQYALFDRAYLEANRFELNGLKNGGMERPAINVSWFDAWCFSHWVGCRQPTEAEWEYACRAGSQKEYCRVKELNTANGFHDIDSSDLLRVAYYGQRWNSGPQAVACFEPSFWNFYDMLGNVSEWCADWYGWDYYHNLAQRGNVSDPTGPSTGWLRILRGGSFFGSSDSCRAAFREFMHPGGRSRNYGFRLVRSLSSFPASPSV